MKAEVAWETHRALFCGVEGLWREVMGRGGCNMVLEVPGERGRGGDEEKRRKQVISPSGDWKGPSINKTLLMVPLLLNNSERLERRSPQKIVFLFTSNKKRQTFCWNWPLGDNGTRKGSTCTLRGWNTSQKLIAKMVTQKHNYNLQTVLGKL